MVVILADAYAYRASCAVEELQNWGTRAFLWREPTGWQFAVLFIETHAGRWGRVDAAKMQKPPAAVQTATGLVQWGQEHANARWCAESQSRCSVWLVACVCCAFVFCLNLCVGSPEAKPMQRDGAALFVRPCPRGTEPPCVEPSAMLAEPSSAAACGSQPTQRCEIGAAREPEWWDRSGCVVSCRTQMALSWPYLSSSSWEEGEEGGSAAGQGREGAE